MNAGNQPRDHRDTSVDDDMLSGAGSPENGVDVVRNPAGNSGPEALDKQSQIGEGLPKASDECEPVTSLEVAAVDGDGSASVLESDGIEHAVDEDVPVEWNEFSAKCGSIVIHGDPSLVHVSGNTVDTTAYAGLSIEGESLADSDAESSK